MEWGAGGWRPLALSGRIAFPFLTSQRPNVASDPTTPSDSDPTLAWLFYMESGKETEKTPTRQREGDTDDEKGGNSKGRRPPPASHGSG